MNAITEASTHDTFDAATKHQGSIYKGQFLKSSFSLRWATHADYEDVIHIDDNVYGGGDYLPSTYHETLDETTAHCFIAELDDNVIGFVCYWIDGLTNTMTTSSAGRVNAKYRHQGLYIHFTKLVELEMKKRYPCLQFDWSVSQVSLSLVKRVELDNGRLVYKKDHVFCTVLSEDIHGCYRGNDLRNVHVNVYSSSSSSELIDLLSDPNVLNYLYPKGVFIHADRFIPFPTSAYYIRNAFLKDPVIISGTLESHDLALSSLNVHACPLGARLSISYDGIPDSKIIKAHILKAVETMARSCLVILNEQKRKLKKGNTPKLKMGIYFPCQVDQNSIWEFVKETFHSLYSEDIFKTFGLFEKPYH